MKRRNITFFEGTMIISVIAILSIYISLQWPVQDRQLRSFCSQLSHDIRFTQHLAQSTEAVHTLIITPTQYWIVDADQRPVQHPVAGVKPITIPPGTWIRLHWATKKGGATSAKNVAADHRAFITFDTTGAPKFPEHPHAPHALQLDVLSQSAKHHIEIAQDTGWVVMT